MNARTKSDTGRNKIFKAKHVKKRISKSSNKRRIKKFTNSNKKKWFSKDNLILFSIFILMTGIAILIFSIIKIYSLDSDYLPKNPNNFTVGFNGDLSDVEIELSKSMIEKLNPLYTKYVQDIYFTKNASQLCNVKKSKECRTYCGVDRGCRGINREGYIIINWIYGEKTVESTLCHEIMHQWIETKSNSLEDPPHAIIDDLGKKGVCY